MAKRHKIILSLDENEYDVLKLYKAYLEERDPEGTYDLTLQMCAKDLLDNGLVAFCEAVEAAHKIMDETREGGLQ